MNFADIIVLALVVALLCVCVRNVFPGKKTGCSSCCGNCASCSMCMHMSELRKMK
ncbi:MAG: FeoB-associated Cys-rich membrane protein [Erysipelotrichaceae bacterium]|nr:FeoB-associated Cys-rich membrane protein [Erysipelotrichaceae bacterium]MBQ1533658.1 FeoB-associated Cys-rich membrane protein [Erysipelotrichaceae bacterium]MBQ1788516.1 FeoB-associated Cys-rich membrane protein [Erysipelotrichaceae bacterium]MBQ5804481.1 FeoB-associated Cys-rich membrane protein [Erysipelotrichaceae bacterium]